MENRFGEPNVPSGPRGADETTRLIREIADQLGAGGSLPAPAPAGETAKRETIETFSMRTVEADKLAEAVQTGRLRYDPDGLEDLSDLMASGDIQFWVLDPTAEDAAGSDGFAGQVAVRWSGTRKAQTREVVGDAAYLAFLEVDESLRGTGLGAELLNKVIAAASERQQGVFLAVESDNDGAKRLFERSGFANTGLTTQSPLSVRQQDGTYITTEPATQDIYLRPYGTIPKQA